MFQDIDVIKKEYTSKKPNKSCKSIASKSTCKPVKSTKRMIFRTGIMSGIVRRGQMNIHLQYSNIHSYLNQNFLLGDP